MVTISGIEGDGRRSSINNYYNQGVNDNNGIHHSAYYNLTNNRDMKCEEGEGSKTYRVKHGSDRNRRRKHTSSGVSTNNVNYSVNRKSSSTTCTYSDSSSIGTSFNAGDYHINFVTPLVPNTNKHQAYTIPSSSTTYNDVNTISNSIQPISSLSHYNSRGKSIFNTGMVDGNSTSNMTLEDTNSNNDGESQLQELLHRYKSRNIIHNINGTDKLLTNIHSHQQAAIKRPVLLIIKKVI